MNTNRCAISFLALVCCSACSKDTAPRTVKQIGEARIELPALYITEISKREVIAPSGTGDVLLDSESGEMAFRAWHCTNPDCAAKKPAGERPSLFIWRDPFYQVVDGEIAWECVGDRETETIARGGTILPTCPACLTIRDQASESEQQKTQYAQWCTEYVLPKTIQRMKELDQEHQRRIESLDERINRKIGKDSG